MAAALRNPRNQKFIILSESDLPLYSPEVLYLQVGGRQASCLHVVWCRIASSSVSGGGGGGAAWLNGGRTQLLSRPGLGQMSHQKSSQSH